VGIFCGFFRFSLNIGKGMGFRESVASTLNQGKSLEIPAPNTGLPL
jgi:hypothetical protein